MSRLELHAWEAPGPYVVAFTTRLGGVSQGPFEALNLGRLTTDDPEHVAENRRLACVAAGADPERLRFRRQTHSATVRSTDEAVQGDEADGDGLWSRNPGEAMIVLTADCVPLAIARVGGDDPALAIIHVGWRGLQQGIVANAVAALARPRAELAAALGPSIGPCCYEVGEEVSGPLEERFGPGLVENRLFDLAAAVERALANEGVARISRVGGQCTSCDEERYFSHRRDQGVTGRQGVIGYIA